MGRESYRKCPGCGRAKGVEDTMLVGRSELTVRVVRCIACRCRSIGDVVVRAPGTRASDVPNVRATLVKALRSKAEQARREAADSLREADECEAEAARLEAE